MIKRKKITLQLEAEELASNLQPTHHFTFIEINLALPHIFHTLD
jgi:hypothetical protein